MTGQPLLEVRDLAVDHVDGNHRTPILRGLSFDLQPAEALGIVGESGSGKSVTLQAIRRTLPRALRATGSITVDGQDVFAMGASRLRTWHSSGVAMIHQDPRAAINPVRTIGDFLTETLRRRLSKNEAVQRALKQLRAVGIANAESRLEQFPHELSGGLLQRVMIASALLDEPDLIMADEPTTALDVTTQQEVMAIIDELRRERGMAMILVTHDLDLAAAVTDRVATFYAGSLVEMGESNDLHRNVLHPYTRGLLDSRPSVTAREELRPIPGRPARASEVGPGCAFVARCPLAISVCETHAPPLVPESGRFVACHRVAEIASRPQHETGASA